MYREIENTQRIAYMIRSRPPEAIACIRGSDRYPDISGTVLFYPVSGGSIIIAEIFGLPNFAGSYGYPIFAFHIHGGTACSGNGTDPFSHTGSHYNPDNRPHPYHAGDLPPLFSNRGYAWQAFLTTRFRVQDVIGRTVLIHSLPDDFRTQPSGDSGIRIACGVIERY